MIPEREEHYWSAVMRRDSSLDGSFVYAVLTTGVYCRPGCPSRLARRENVTFYPTPEDAAMAGYRPCKRCRPDEADRDPWADIIRRACRLIDEAEDMPDLLALACEAGYSPWYFQRRFKAHVGLSPKQYAIAKRKARLRAALPEAESVTDAIYAAGFGASSRAYEDASGLGMKPRTYRGGGGGETIRFASAQSSLGEVFVAATLKGICMIEFGERATLVDQLAHRFPMARIEAANGSLAELIAAVVALIDEPASGQALPLDIRGTAFQERVWKALTEIPLGETATYTDIAGRIGRPRAARAVARACATNGIAVAVPCHRVVRASGELSGYKWGIERKQALLERESTASVIGAKDD